MMIPELIDNPFFGLLLTIGVYQIGGYLQRKIPHPFVNPLALSVIFIILFLSVTGIPYESYNEGGSVLALFVTPATVSLAVPLEKNFHHLKKYYSSILIGIFTGVFVHGILIALFSLIFSLNDELVATLLPKSVTTPIAVGISESMGGIGSLTIAVVILTGIIGSVFAPSVFRLLRINDEVAQGISLGSASHAVGTSKAIELGEVQGAMSGLAIIVTGIITVLISPLLFSVYTSLFL